MNFCERDMPKEAAVEVGVVWPRDSKGERSTTAAGKDIWARYDQEAFCSNLMCISF